MSASLDDTSSKVKGAKIGRRSWSRAEKQRIMEAAFRPGASVADVARQHGLNANQVFNWRRAAWATATNVAPAERSPNDASSVAEAAGFVPFGLIVRANAEARPAMPRPASMTGPAAPDRTPPLYLAMEERVGLMEIDLAGGTRLRVDAFVNERALRRVLSVLKALA